MGDGARHPPLSPADEPSRHLVGHLCIALERPAESSGQGLGVPAAVPGARAPGAKRQTFWRDQLRGQLMTVGNSLMDDHVFVDRRTFEHLKSAEIVDTPEVRGLSDHAPVVVDLVLPEQAGQPVPCDARLVKGAESI